MLLSLCSQHHLSYFLSLPPVTSPLPSPSLGRKERKKRMLTRGPYFFLLIYMWTPYFLIFFADWDTLLAKLGIHTTTRPNCMVLYGLRVEIYGIGDKLDIGLRDSKWTYSFFIRGLTCAHPWFCLIRPKCLMHSDILGRPIPGEGLWIRPCQSITVNPTETHASNCTELMSQ